MVNLPGMSDMPKFEPPNSSFQRGCAKFVKTNDLGRQCEERIGIAFGMNVLEIGAMRILQISFFVRPEADWGHWGRSESPFGFGAALENVHG